MAFKALRVKTSWDHPLQLSIEPSDIITGPSRKVKLDKVKGKRLDIKLMAQKV